MTISLQSEIALDAWLAVHDIDMQVLRLMLVMMEIAERKALAAGEVPHA